MTPQQQAQNAIEWIDELPNGKQAPMGKRAKLGNALDGFCCIGYGCHIFGVSRDGTAYVDQAAYETFSDLVGLYGCLGEFEGTTKDCRTLARLNDRTEIGFQGISDLMRTKPHWMFKPEVAELIAAHYKGKEL